MVERSPKNAGDVSSILTFGTILRVSLPMQQHYNKHYDGYWQSMSMVCERLNSALDKFCHLHPEFLPVRDIYVCKKHLNGLQFYAGYAAATDDDRWMNYWSLPIIIELTMLWAYKTNQIVDEKKEVWQDKQQLKNTVLEHDLLLSLILTLEREAEGILKERFLLFHKIVSLIISSVTNGFWKEREISTKFYEVKNVLEDWETKYFDRNRLLNAVYDYAPLVGFWAATFDDTIFEVFEHHFEKTLRFSEVGQVVNDLADWAPVFNETERSYQDRYADIRNGLITFPVHHLISSSCINEALGNPELTYDQQWRQEVTRLVRNSGIVADVKKKGALCLNDLINFWRLHKRTDSQIIFQQYLTLVMNKYFASLRTDLSLAK